jgi:hypothetical protein
MKAPRDSRGIAHCFYTSAPEGGGGQRHAPVAFYPGKDSVPIIQETGWAPGPVWTGAENLALTGIRSTDRPARSQSLYRLSYPVHPLLYLSFQNLTVFLFPADMYNS